MEILMKNWGINRLINFLSVLNIWVKVLNFYFLWFQGRSDSKNFYIKDNNFVSFESFRDRVIWNYNF